MKRLQFSSWSFCQPSTEPNMAIASRQLSRLRQRTQELKAQEQALKSETETLKAQEQTLQHETEMLKNLLFTIESEKSKTPKKENFTLNSLHSSLGPKTREAIEGAIDNLFLQHKIRNATIWQSGFPIGSPIPAEVAMRVINKSRFIVYKSMLERLVDKTVTVQHRADRDTLADALRSACLNSPSSTSLPSSASAPRWWRK